MGFNAAEAEKELPTLDYDFRPHVNASGITPEPNKALIDEFQKAQRHQALLLGKEDFDPTEQAAVLKFQRSLSDEDIEKLNDIFYDAFAKLTQGRPSKDDLKSFDEARPRLCRYYMADLMGSILNPKAVNDALKD